MDKNDVIKLLDAYNVRMAEIYNDMIVSSDLPLNLELNRMGSVEKIVNQKMIEWMKHYKSGLGSSNFYDYLRNTIDPETAYKFVVYASSICDDGVPSIFIHLLDRHKATLEKQIMNYVIEIDWENHNIADSYADDKITSVAALLNTLSEWRLTCNLEPLILKYSRNHYPYDIISDAFKNIVIQSPEADNTIIINELRRMLNKHDDLSLSGENLLISLVEKNKGRQLDDVYECLLRCFEEMSNKQIAIICFADLGDNRAIQDLRAWLLSDSDDNIDSVLVKEAVSSLKRLGDQTGDLEARYAQP